MSSQSELKKFIYTTKVVYGKPCVEVQTPAGRTYSFKGKKNLGIDSWQEAAVWAKEDIRRIKTALELSDSPPCRFILDGVEFVDNPKKLILDPVYSLLIEAARRGLTLEFFLSGSDARYVVRGETPDGAEEEFSFLSEPGKGQTSMIQGLRELIEELTT